MTYERAGTHAGAGADNNKKKKRSKRSQRENLRKFLFGETRSQSGVSFIAAEKSRQHILISPSQRRRKQTRNTYHGGGRFFSIPFFLRPTWHTTTQENPILFSPETERVAVFLRFDHDQAGGLFLIRFLTSFASSTNTKKLVMAPIHQTRHLW